MQRLYLADLEGKIRLNQISPRCFEAAALRTLMILYPGEYSGVLLPYKHYTPLAKDHSNMEEVVAILRDSARCEEIVRTAFDEVARNSRYTFRTFVEQFDERIGTCWRNKKLEAADAYSLAELQSDARLDFASRRRRWQSKTFGDLYRLIFGKALRFLPPKGRDRIQMAIKSSLIKVKSFLGAARIV